jgi:hypothetical protein
MTATKTHSPVGEKAAALRPASRQRGGRRLTALPVDPAFVTASGRPLGRRLNLKESCGILRIAESTMRTKLAKGQAPPFDQLAPNAPMLIFEGVLLDWIDEIGRQRREQRHERIEKLEPVVST